MTRGGATDRQALTHIGEMKGELQNMGSTGRDLQNIRQFRQRSVAFAFGYE
jgi:hypothetical protein